MLSGGGSFSGLGGGWSGSGVVCARWGRVGLLVIVAVLVMKNPPEDCKHHADQGQIGRPSQ
jgi:hypothetical protein